MTTARQHAGEALQTLATEHATEARKDLLSGYLVTASRSLGPSWARGFTAGLLWLAEVARRDTAMAVEVGALLDELGADNALDSPRDDLAGLVTEFIRRWDIAG